jgi:hypothetical protein
MSAEELRYNQATAAPRSWWCQHLIDDGSTFDCEKIVLDGNAGGDCPWGVNGR